MNDTENREILTNLPEQRALSLNVESLSRGIDNYHVDVNLSKRFCSSVKKVTDLLVSQLAVPTPKKADHSKVLDELRESYVDMLTVLIHRVKTDLKPNEVCFLQFAASKFIITSVRSRVQADLNSLATRTSDLRNKGATEALVSSQKLFWLRKNLDSILYSINKIIFNHLLRAENRFLAPIRSQYLPEQYAEFTEFAFNPLLFVHDLNSLNLLIGEYRPWDTNSRPDGFVTLNDALEELCREYFPASPASPLKQEGVQESDLTEITDELGGLFASQPFLGKAKDNKSLLIEQFGWLDNPLLVQDLFNLDNYSEGLEEVRKSSGMGDWWDYRKEVKRLEKFLRQFVRIMKKQNLLTLMFAAYEIRSIWNPVIAERLELKTACLYASGGFGSRNLSEVLGPGQNPTPEQQKLLEDLKTKIQKLANEAPLDQVTKIIADICRYRLHLKYFRFVHRIFNRINILSRPADIQLSKEAGSLYQMPTSDEIEEGAARVCHHTILKADVRGSTRVTNELQNRGLNPASYFSLRFFDPINEFLETFNAKKLFIEGDAIILGFLEYEHLPQNWYCVSHACGMAREMISIVKQSNRHSKQMDLPVLELGIGICFSPESPLYLYDDGRPIMISGAIGLADNLSSCSWSLRDQVQPELYNVEVYRIGDDNGKADKGQQFVRYNVDGILLDNAAFDKLKMEVALTRITLELEHRTQVFYSGQYPDHLGKKHELVIREGQVGLWKNGQIVPDTMSNEVFYEVVVNKSVATQVLESKNRAAASN